MKIWIIKKLKALRIYAVMCGFITHKQYVDSYKKYVESSTDEEVGTFDWFVYYCKKNKEFRIEHLA
jgi:hypothetical protein